MALSDKGIEEGPGSTSSSRIGLFVGDVDCTLSTDVLVLVQPVQRMLNMSGMKRGTPAMVIPSTCLSTEYGKYQVGIRPLLEEDPSATRTRILVMYLCTPRLPRAPRLPT